MKIFDLEKIDYKFLEKLYNKKIPENILNNRGHFRTLIMGNRKENMTSNNQTEIYIIYQLIILKMVPVIPMIFIINQILERKFYHIIKKILTFLKNMGSNTQFKHFLISITICSFLFRKSIKQ